jgi:hypothetical protein
LFFYGNISKTSFIQNAAKLAPELWWEMVEDYEESKKIFWPLIHVNAHYLSDSAYLKNQVLYDPVETRLLDNPSASSSPYIPVKLFCSTPMIQLIRFEDAKFVFTDSLWFSNDKETLVSFFIDFDDGNGFVEVVPNTEIPQPYTIDGDYYPVVRVITTTDTLVTKTYIKVQLTDPDQNRGNVICWYPYITANYPVELPDLGPFDISIPNPNHSLNRPTIEGEYAVWLGCGNTKIRKPLILSPGFNPGGTKKLLPCIFNIADEWFSLLGFQIPNSIVVPAWSWNGAVRAHSMSPLMASM